MNEHPANPLLVERTVTLRVSTDTAGLWDALALQLGVSFDELVQMLTMYGAFLLASADSGYLEGLQVSDLTPEAMTAIFIPWLKARTRVQP